MIRTPYITGDTATFVWQGAEAPLLIGDFNRWNPADSPTFEQKTAENWTCEIRLPSDAYIEYAYRQDREHVLDPGNPRKVSNGFDKFNNYFYMPGAAPTPLISRRVSLPRGSVTWHKLPVNQRSRQVVLYQPPVDEPCPLLVVYDGTDYLRQARLLTILDNLIDQKRIRPIAAALVANGGPLRLTEYHCNDATIAFVRNELLPLAQEHLNLLDPTQSPGAYGVMGASMGGLMAMYTGMRLPQIFGYILSQSGAFFPWSVINDLIRLSERLPLKVWMDVGRLERLQQVNQAYYDLLVAKGYFVSYRVYSGGHNYTAWRDDLWRGLEYLYGSQS